MSFLRNIFQGGGAGDNVNILPPDRGMPPRDFRDPFSTQAGIYSLPFSRRELINPRPTPTDPRGLMSQLNALYDRTITPYITPKEEEAPPPDDQVPPDDGGGTGGGGTGGGGRLPGDGPPYRPPGDGRLPPFDDRFPPIDFPPIGPPILPPDFPPRFPPDIPPNIPPMVPPNMPPPPFGNIDDMPPIQVPPRDDMVFAGGSPTFDERGPVFDIESIRNLIELDNEPEMTESPMMMSGISQLLPTLPDPTISEMDRIMEDFDRFSPQRLTGANPLRV